LGVGQFGFDASQLETYIQQFNSQKERYLWKIFLTHFIKV
jgi:hypothetical protein